MFWRPHHRFQIWSALKKDDPDALRKALGPAVENTKLFRELDKGLWKDGGGKHGSSPVSLTYTCAANKAGVNDAGAPKCLKFLLQTYRRTAYRNYCEKIDAQAMALLCYRFDVIKTMQELRMWTIPGFIRVKRCAAVSFDLDNSTKVGLALARELGTPEDYSHEVVTEKVTPEFLLPPPQPHTLFCRGGGVTVDFYAKNVRRFSVQLSNNSMYHLKKEWNGTMRIRSVFKSPTLSMYSIPA